MKENTAEAPIDMLQPFFIMLRNKKSKRFDFSGIFQIRTLAPPYPEAFFL